VNTSSILPKTPFSKPIRPILRVKKARQKGADTVETPKLRAFQVKVQLGQTIGANVVIKSGIKEGDRVIVDGVQAIHEGSPINASSRPAGAAGADSSNSKK
jgi:multidrug efflux pump subunit AcrA (membrane-fusion protein)